MKEATATIERMRTLLGKEDSQPRAYVELLRHQADARKHCQPFVLRANCFPNR